MTTPDDINSILFVSEGGKYGDKYVEHVLEQYKVYLQAANAVSDRRQKANEFFLALNTALVTVLGYMSTKPESTNFGLMFVLAAIAGITVDYLWYRIIQSYKGLNGGKYEVVHAIEQRLPLALYDAEWQMLGRGKDKRKYWPFTHIELLVPWVFVAIYVVVLLAGIMLTLGRSPCGAA